MKNLLRLTLIILLAYSCETDYDMKQHFGEFKPRVVLNSIITPEETITAELYWSKEYNDASSYKKVQVFTAELYENDLLISTTKDTEGVIKTDIKPKSGSNYRFEIEVPNYGVLMAQTNIPLPASHTIEFLEKRQANPPYGKNFYHFNINEISTQEQLRAIWITVDAQYEIYHDNIYDLWMDNPFIDQINRSGGSFGDVPISVRGTDTYYEDFIRTPYKQINQAIPIKFAIGADKYRSNTNLDPNEILYDTTISDDYWQDTILTQRRDTIQGLRINILSPSTDYDRFTKSVREQRNSFMSPIPVYTNVENGLGVFAGYNNNPYFYTITLDKDDNNGGFFPHIYRPNILYPISLRPRIYSKATESKTKLK